MHRQHNHGRLAHDHIRRRTARDTHQRLGDDHRRRRRVLSHLQSDYIRDECGERSVLDSTASRHHAEKHTRHQDSPGDSTRPRVDRSSHASTTKRLYFF